MYNDELSLVNKTYTQDAIGNQVESEEYLPILCNVKSVGRNEFYNAAQQGLKPNLVFVIHKYEYGEQEFVVYAGQKYKVIRTYSTDFEEVELTCEKVLK